MNLNGSFVNEGEKKLPDDISLTRKKEINTSQNGDRSAENSRGTLYDMFGYLVQYYFLLFDRSLTAIGNFLSASGILSDEKPQITTCHACEKKKRKEKEKRKADMYYYVCNNVCCDNYGGVGVVLSHSVAMLYLFR